MNPMPNTSQRINFTIKYPDFKGRNTFTLLKVIHYSDGTSKKGRDPELKNGARYSARRPFLNQGSLGQKDSIYVYKKIARL